MVEYFEALYVWLQQQNGGCQSTLARSLTVME